jgi:hypothetical protein
MAAAYQELFLEQGTTFTTNITLDNVDGTPLNLTGVTAKSQIRKSYYSANTTAQFDVAINIPTSGVILLTLNAPTTANIAAGRYVYDVAIKDTTNTVTRVLEGIVNVIPQVTKF